MSVIKRNGNLFYVSIRYRRDGVTHRFYKRAVNPDNVDQAAKDETRAAYYDLRWQELINEGADVDAIYDGKVKPKPVEVRKITVAELIADVWPKELAANRYRKPESWPGYPLKRILADFGHVILYRNPELSEVTTRGGQEWMDLLLSEGFAPSTVNRHYEAARLVWRWALDKNLITVNPWIGVRKIHEPRAVKRIMTHKEEAALLKACRNPTHESHRRQLETAIVILVETGMRPEGEFFNQMQRWQVDLNNKVLTIVGHKGRGGARTERQMPISARALPYFRELCEGKGDNEIIFPYASLKTSWASAKEEAGIKSRLCLRWLRDTCENRMKMRGIRQEDILAMIGHSETIARRYNQVEINHVRQLMNKEQGDFGAKTVQNDPAKKERQAVKLADKLLCKALLQA